MIKERCDILSRILQSIREKQPTITEEVLIQAEAEVRKEWGGTEAYIQKQKVETRRNTVKRQFDGTNAVLLRQQLGVSQATFYRSLKK